MATRVDDNSFDFLPSNRTAPEVVADLAREFGKRAKGVRIENFSPADVATLLQLPTTKRLGLARVVEELSHEGFLREVSGAALTAIAREVGRQAMQGLPTPPMRHATLALMEQFDKLGVLPHFRAGQLEGKAKALEALDPSLGGVKLSPSGAWVAGSTNSPNQVPFTQDASEQWEPAFRDATGYAKTKGFANLQFEPTGVMANSDDSQPMVRPPSRGGAAVNAMEKQEVFELLPDGERFVLGLVLPEAQHGKTLKSAQMLTAELRFLIDRMAASRDGAKRID